MHKKFLVALWSMVAGTVGYSHALEDTPQTLLPLRKIYSKEARLSGIDGVVHEALEKFQVPGLALGLVVDDKIIISHGYGLRDIRGKSLVTEETVFPIGSCTKPFTALLLAQLVEEEALSWDDPVVRYLPEFRLFNAQATEDVTLRDLIAHRTGIPRHDAIWYCQKKSRSEVLKSLPYLEPLWELRHKWHYNNAMYAVAALVIEKVTGQPWEELLSTQIFSPLDMSSSNASLTQMQRRRNFSLPHAEIEGVVKTLPFHPLYALEAGGAINSSVADMLKWVQSQLSTKSHCLVDKETLEEMHSPQILFSSREQEELGMPLVGYGLGWFVGKYKEHEVVLHGGSIDGFHSEVAMLPHKNIGIVILTNSSSDGKYAITAIRNTLLDRLLGGLRTDWMAVAQQEREKAKARLSPSINTSLSPAYSLSYYTGCYENPAYGVVEITSKNNQLVAAYGNILIPLNYEGERQEEEEQLFKGQLRELLAFGVSQRADFLFQQPSDEHFSEVKINFDPLAPVIFKRRSEGN